MATSFKRYAIIGTGAIGGYYGARLQQAGCEVHFLLRSDYESVAQKGLVIESAQGDFALPEVHAYADPSQMPTIDVVIIALKTTQNHQLANLLPPLAPGAVVLTLQNGLDIEGLLIEQLQDRLQGHVILGGLCFICSNKVGPGQIRHLDYGQVQLGAYGENLQPQPVTPVMEAIAADFRAAQIPITLTEDLFLARWRKLVWNVPYNGLSVVLDASTQAMMADAGLRSLISTLMEEVITTANAWCQFVSQDASGEVAEESIARAIPLSFVDDMLSATEKMKPYRTSMKIDYDEGRPLEVEAILGNPVRIAEQIGVAVPHMKMLYQQIRFLGDRNIDPSP